MNELPQENQKTEEKLTWVDPELEVIPIVELTETASVSYSSNDGPSVYS